MKRVLLLAALFIMAVSCTQNKGPKMLVLYYSQTETTKAVAEEIANRLGADIEAIVPVESYGTDYQATIARGNQEMREGKLPELQPLASDISKYDVIFLGYPIWFGTYAVPVGTLLETADFSGKKVVPFCTFGSGGLDTSVKAIKEKLTDATVLNGYGVRAARIDAAPAEIDRFLKENGFLEGEFTEYGDFSDPKPVTEEESALFDAAVGDYPMINAKAEEVASRAIENGMEYIFTARDLPRMPGMDMPAQTMKVYVLAEDGKAPVFTQVVR